MKATGMSNFKIISYDDLTSTAIERGLIKTFLRQSADANLLNQRRREVHEVREMVGLMLIQRRREPFRRSYRAETTLPGEFGDVIVCRSAREFGRHRVHINYTRSR